MKFKYFLSRKLHVVLVLVPSLTLLFFLLGGIFATTEASVSRCVDDRCIECSSRDNCRVIIGVGTENEQVFAVESSAFQRLRDKFEQVRFFLINKGITPGQLLSSAGAVAKSACAAIGVCQDKGVDHQSRSIQCAGKTQPLYELLSGKDGEHHYTTQAGIRDRYIYERGYHDYGVVAQVFKNGGRNRTALSGIDSGEGYVSVRSGSSLIPLYRYEHQENGNVFYTTKNERVLLEALSYKYRGIEGYVCQASPMITLNEVFAIADETLRIEGSGLGGSLFGEPKADRMVVFTSADDEIVIESKDTEIIHHWSNRLIEMQTPPNLTSEYSVRIVTRETQSNQVPVSVYTHTTYRPFNLDGVAGNPHPIDIAIDQTGTLWINSEFSRGFMAFDTIEKESKYITDIQPENNPIFSFAGTPSTLSEAGEDVDIDSQGYVWYVQGGSAYTQDGNARIVALNPNTGIQQCYNLPTNGLTSFGIAIDDRTGTVWSGTADISISSTQNYLFSFQPRTFTERMTSCNYDFRSSLPANFCTAGKTDGCFTRYELPLPLTDAAHFEIGPDNQVWFTSFYGTAIGRINPATGAVTAYPLPENQRTEGHAAEVGSGPWTLEFDGDGNIWIGEHFESHIVRFDRDAALNGGCRRLTADGNNPCATTYDIVYYPDSSWNEDYLHTLALDGRDRVWFTTQTYPRDVGIGFLGVLDTVGEIQMFAPLTDIGIVGGATGLVVDNDARNIWLLGYWDASLHHLERIDS